ncbi:MAG: peptidoglycan DD-metalloendopeptidase family protein [Alphaproteobacteria bacterium]|nr:peptidoglycan DD-metalloendopeptidase family protein [Alphaproteobacteria bacterium]
MQEASSVARAVCLAGALFLTAGSASAAPPGKDEAQDKLKSIRHEIDEAAAKRKQLDEKTAELKKQEKDLAEQLVAAAAKTRAHEKRIQDLEDRLTELQARQAEAEETLHRKSSELAVSLAAMEKLSRRPTAALVLRPASVEDTARTAIVLDQVRQALIREGDDVRRRVRELKALRQDIEIKQAALRTEYEELAARQKEVDRLLAEKKAARETTESAAQQEAKHLQKLAQDASSLEDLLKKLEEEARKAREKPPSGPSFESAEGKMPLPVQGKIVRRFHDKDANGRESDGIFVETRPSAQVIAPHDGKVVFAGPFRDYGELLIIDHGEGYHTLLAGLGRIDASVSQWVLAGEPVGHMGPERAGSGRDSKPRLYIELRHDGRSINPLPWLAGR